APEAAVRGAPGAPGVRPGRLGRAPALQPARPRPGARPVPRGAGHDLAAPAGDDRRGLEARRVAHRERALQRDHVAPDLRRARAQPRRPDRAPQGGTHEVGRPMLWRCREREFDLEGHTLVMGIVNVTPDSFSDGGRYLEPAVAIAHGRSLIAE